MLQEVIIHGLGGQGAITAGQLLARAGLAEGLAVSVIPYYTPEVRGGEANAILVVSSAPIGSVLPAGWDVAILMAQRSAAKFTAETRPGGIVLYNSTLVPPPEAPPGVRTVGIPASDIADHLGNPRVANLILLGALCARWGVISPEAARGAVHAELAGRREKLIPVNIAALEAGEEALRNS